MKTHLEILEQMITEMDMDVINGIRILPTLLEAKKALEKQIPKKYIENRYPWAICPACGGSINTEIVQEHIQNCETSYCEHCGQAIDWSDTE